MPPFGSRDDIYGVPTLLSNGFPTDSLGFANLA